MWNTITRKYEYKGESNHKEEKHCVLVSDEKPSLDTEDMYDDDMSLADYISTSSQAPVNLIIDEMHAIDQLLDRRYADDEDLSYIQDSLSPIIRKVERMVKTSQSGHSSFNWPSSNWYHSNNDLSSIISRLQDVHAACRTRKDMDKIADSLWEIIQGAESNKEDPMQYNEKTIQWNEQKRKYEYKM